MRIISVRESNEYKNGAISYFQSKWPSTPPSIYEDCISHCINSSNPLPQWYLLEKDDAFIGCAGLVTNDFVSRMDLWPWLCALFIDEKHRGNSYGTLLLNRVKSDCKKYGFCSLYLTTAHIGYYEKYGFQYIGQGYHPWNEESRIYQFNLT